VISQAFSKFLLCGEYISIFEPLSLICQAPFETAMRWTKIDDSCFVINGPKEHHTYTLPITDIDINDDYRGVLELLKIYNIPTSMGAQIDILSSVPQQSGLGSSASLLVACAKGIQEFYGIPSSSLISYCQKAENWYHEKSSGIDVIACFYGGTLCIQGQGQEQKIDHLPLLPLKGAILHTGTSKSNTSDCVQHVLKKHSPSSDLWEMGRAYAFGMIESYKNQSIGQFYKYVTMYDDFLRQLGVVPLKVQTFLDTWRRLGGVGKICGSGSIEGEDAGIVILLGMDDGLYEEMSLLCKVFGYSVLFDI
jgi:hydroxymethylglutaryl-CoA synthase